jgi:hypothetical protein
MGTLKRADGGLGERTENTINTEGCTLRIEKVLHGPDGFPSRAFLLKRPKHCYSPPKINCESIALVHRLAYIDDVASLKSTEEKIMRNNDRTVPPDTPVINDRLGLLAA